MRILQVIDSLGRGGAERVVVALTQGLSRGHEVQLACLYDELDLASELRAVGIPVHVFGVRPRRNLALASWRLSAVARTWRPHVVHAHLLDAMLCVATSRLGGARRAATFHNLGLAGGARGGARTRLVRAGLTALVRRFDVVTAVSDASAAAYARELGLRQLPVVVNNPVDLERLDAIAPATRAEAKGQLTPGDVRPLVVCVAKLTWEKDHRTLLSALAALPADSRPRVVMLGDGPLRGDLAALTHALKLTSSVDWLGAREAREVYAWLRAADVAVLSSVSEGQPVSVLEAMALQTPMVATGVGGVPELLDAGRGWLVAASDSGALAITLREALGAEHERTQRASRARAFIEREFSLAAIVPEWEELFRSS